MSSIKFDPLPHSTGRITGIIKPKFFGFIRDDTTRRELIFIRRDVTPVEAWEELKIGDRVRYFVEPDFLHPGRFKAVEVARIIDEAMTGGPPRPVPGELEIRAGGAETLNEANPGDAHREDTDPPSGGAAAA